MRALSLLVAATLASPALAGPGERAGEIMARITDPGAGVIAIAHRGCHEAAPDRGLKSAPENSIASLDHCVAIGVDVMEADVRMTRDGHLVMVHDDRVDRTTNGTGKVSDLTLAQIRALRLRDDLGGKGAALTAHRVPTLAEMLAHAGNRIVLNLDVKAPVHAETIAAVRAAGAERRVLVKATAGIASVPLSATPPFDRVPFLPMLSSADASARDLPMVVARQASGVTRPVGFEIPRMPSTALPALAAATCQAGGRIWANSLWEGFVAGIGGDAEALANPDAVWGALVREGVTMIQTDHPAALVRFLRRSPVSGYDCRARR